MRKTTISAREFEKHPRRARKAAANGPVLIIEHGWHAFALLTIEEYRRIGGRAESILDLIADPKSAKIEFDPPRVGLEFPRPADFS